MKKTKSIFHDCLHTRPTDILGRMEGPRQWCVPVLSFSLYKFWVRGGPKKQLKAPGPLKNRCDTKDARAILGFWFFPCFIFVAKRRVFRKGFTCFQQCSRVQPPSVQANSACRWKDKGNPQGVSSEFRPLQGTPRFVLLVSRSRISERNIHRITEKHTSGREGLDSKKGGAQDARSGIVAHPGPVVQRQQCTLSPVPAVWLLAAGRGCLRLF